MFSKQKDIFSVHKIDTNDGITVVDDLVEPNDENAEYEELHEMSVDTSYGREDYNAINFRIFHVSNLSSGPLETW